MNNLISLKQYMKNIEIRDNESYTFHDNFEKLFKKNKSDRCLLPSSENLDLM